MLRRRKLRATLDVVRNAVSADLVFLYTGATGQTSDWSGLADPDPAACTLLCRVATQQELGAWTGRRSET